MIKRHLTISALALILMSGCSDATGVTLDDLAGTWTASSMLFTSQEDANLFADIVDDGATLTLVLDADGSYTFAFTFPEEDPEDETGTYTASGTTLSITPLEGELETFTLARDGDSMTLTDDDVFDFDTGNEEDATLVITLER